jgi:hypothetical protein
MLAGELVVGRNRLVSLPGLIQCRGIVFQHLRRIWAQRVRFAKEGQSFLWLICGKHCGAKIPERICIFGIAGDRGAEGRDRFVALAEAQERRA